MNVLISTLFIERRSVAAIAIALAVGCGGNGRRTLVPGPETIAATMQANPPYVVRMSDGVRDWEVEFPGGSTGYDVRIPLRGRGGASEGIEDLPPTLTDADRELISEMRRDGGTADREGVFHGGEDLVASDSSQAAPGPLAGAEAPAPSRPSYLLGVSEVRRLYRSGNPEIAMVRLERLLQAYPDDTRLLAMKGTLWLRLGRPELARRAYEEVLRREPDNRAVQQALLRVQHAQGGEAAELDFPEPAGTE